MEVKEGGLVIYNINGDHIENGGLKIVYGSEKRKANDDVVSDEDLQRKIDFVKPRIKNKRQWFSVCKYLMWHKVVAEGDFRAALEKLEELCPGLGLDLNDMQRLNAQSFSKSLDKWDIENAPVAGNAFAKYYAIAEMMESA